MNPFVGMGPLGSYLLPQVSNAQIDHNYSTNHLDSADLQSLFDYADDDLDYDIDLDDITIDFESEQATLLGNNPSEQATRTTRPVKFVFPTTLQQGSEDSSSARAGEDCLTLRDWLLNQQTSKSKESKPYQLISTEEDNNAQNNKTDNHNKSPTNTILLDPDPTLKTIGPVTSSNTISCKLCREKLQSEMEVKIHVTHCWLQNKNQHRYCVPCEKSFFSISSARNHFLSFHATPEEKAGQPKFKCQICSKSFKCRSYIKIHLELHKQKELQPRLFVCEICGVRFPNLSNLTSHLKTHSDDRPYKCSEAHCSAAFKTKGSLNCHFKIHTGLKPFKCSEPGCSKIFKERSILVQHERVHTGERPFHCEGSSNCRKKFTSGFALKLHLRLHHGQKEDLPKFQCDICKKTFLRKHVLEKHILVHNQDRPYKCSHEGCSAAYKHKHVLEDHERVHSGEQPYQCDFCGKSYSRKTSFTRHMKNHRDSEASIG